MIRELKTSIGLKRSSSSCETLAFDLLNSITVIHIAHLGITGVGSYAIHKALGEYYEGVVNLVDSFIEQYQGITGKVMDFPNQFNLPNLKTSESCIIYLKDLRTSIDREQIILSYSEIINILDEVKSLINSTCYKLSFLK